MAKSKADRWLEPDGLILIEGWARDGLTNEQIAHNMGVGLSTLKEYRNRYPAIETALKKGKEVVDYMVENALFKSAMEGNVTAQIFWLKNRRPDKWRDKPQYTDNDTYDDDGFMDALRNSECKMVDDMHLIGGENNG